MSSDQPYFASFQVFVNNTNFVQVQDKLVVPRAYSCYVSVVSASLPVTFYNLRGFQLTFTYRVATESINRFFTFTVPQGHYSSTELADACLWSGTLAGTTNTTQFFTAYQGQQNKFQMMFSPNSQLTMFALTPGTLANQMGFTASTTDMYGTYFPNAFVTSTAPNVWSDTNYPLCRITFADTGADLSGTNNIQIVSTFKVKYFSGGTQTLAVVPISSDYCQTQQYSSDFQAQLYDNVFGDFSLGFLDDYGNSINFNGCSWSVALQFSFKNPSIIPKLEDTQDDSIAQQVLGTDDFLGVV